MPQECYGPDEIAPREPMAINFYYEIRQFLDVIQKKRTTELTFERGRYIQELIEAAQRSADTGETVSLF